MEKYGPTGVRAIGALFGVTPLSGAVAGGLSEGAAEWMEGKDFSPRDIGTAAATGALGGGLVRAIGKAGAAPMKAAVAAAPWAAAAPVVQSLGTTGELPELSDVATSTAVGSGTAWGLARLLKGMGMPLLGDVRKAPLGKAVEVEMQGVRGAGPATKKFTLADDAPGPLDPGVVKTPTPPPVAPRIPYRSDDVMGPRQQKIVTAEAKAATAAEKTAMQLEKERIAAEEITTAREGGLVPKESVSESFAAPIPGGTERMTRRYVQPPEEGAEPGVGGLASALGVAAREAATVAPTASAAEAASVYQPEMGLDELKALISNRLAKEQERPIIPLNELPAVSQANLARGGVLPAPAPTPQAGPAIPREAPTALPAPAAVQPEVSPLTLFKGTPGDISAQHYAQLKALLKSGAEPGLPREAVGKVAGRAFQRIGNEEAAAAGRPWAAPTAPAGPSPVAAEKVAPAPGQAPSEGQAALAAGGPKGLMDYLKRRLAEEGPRPGTGAGLGLTGGGKFGSERGAVSPELLASLGLGAVGAAAGATTTDDPLLGAVAGGALGASLPTAFSKISSLAPKLAQTVAAGVTPPDVAATVTQFADPKTASDAIMKGIAILPTILRHNLLASPNLLNNAFVAPWSSGMVAATEMHLAGDPRGLAAIRLFTPENWARAYYESWSEAAQLIGTAERAGGELIGEAPEGIRKLLAGPGTIMTGGDVATRKLLMQAGFSEAEARAATLTSEPEGAMLKKLVELPRHGGPLAQLIMPFAKTIANVAEQGSQRIPGLGYLFQAQRAVPDTMRLQTAKQAMGAAAAAGGYGIGSESEDLINMFPAGSQPVVRKMLSSFASNVGGPASLLSTMGYAAGRAGEAGGDIGDQGRASALAALRDLPLPSVDLPISYVNWATSDDPNHPLPAGIVPGIVRDLFAEENKAAPTKRRVGHKPNQPDR